MRSRKPSKNAARSVAAKCVRGPPKHDAKQLPPADDLIEIGHEAGAVLGRPRERRLPVGMTPRLLSRDAASAYCGVTAETFEQHVRPHVRPVEIGARRLWDVRALDRWLDRQSGLVEAFRSPEEWLAELGDDCAGGRR